VDHARCWLGRRTTARRVLPVLRVQASIRSSFRSACAKPSERRVFRCRIQRIGPFRQPQPEVILEKTAALSEPQIDRRLIAGFDCRHDLPRQEMQKFERAPDIVIRHTVERLDRDAPFRGSGC
jgi:hypothetical protein